MGKITSIKQLNKEQLAKYNMARDLAIHLHNIGQIKEEITEEKMEESFLKLLNKKIESEK